MKKILAVALIAGISLTFVACGSKTNDAQNDTVQEESQPQVIIKKQQEVNNDESKEEVSASEKNTEDASIFIEFDENQYEFRKEQGSEEVPLLWDKTQDDVIMIIVYTPNTTVDKEIKKDNDRLTSGKDVPEFKEVVSDLQIEATKYVNSYRDYPDYKNDKNNYTLIPFYYHYYIPHGDGVFELMAYAEYFDAMDSQKRANMLNSISVISLSENKAMQNAKLVDPPKKKIAE